MLEWILFGIYAVILCAMAIVVREAGAMRRTIWTLVAVAIVGTGFQLLFGNTWHYSAFMVAVNAVACRVITKQPAAQWQALIGWSFVIQIGADLGRVAREINSGTSDMTFLYWVTTAIAFAQLLLVIGWGCHARYRGDRRRFRPDPMGVAAAHSEGVA